IEPASSKSTMKSLASSLRISIALPDSFFDSGSTAHLNGARKGCSRSTVRTSKKLRSEEHTSELQSRFDLVCRLLLEKKKITRKDIEKEIQEGQQAAETASPEDQKAVETKAAPTAVQSSAGDVEIPVTGVRKAIPATMVRAKQEIPHAWITVEVDLTDLVSYRKQIKDTFNLQCFFFNDTATSEIYTLSLHDALPI